MKLKHSIQHQDNGIMKVMVVSPFDTGISLEQNISYQEIINEAVFNGFRKSVEMLLRKALTGENVIQNNETRTQMYCLLSQLYQPNDFAEMLTKIQQFKEYLGEIEQFKMVTLFLEKHLNP